jgi:hypothetical protein
MTDIDEILHRILKAIGPDQHGGIERILTALQTALTVQIALAHSDCRENITRRLRADLPAMLNMATQFARELQDRFGEQRFLH